MGKVVSVSVAVVLAITAGAFADMVTSGINFSGAGDSATASLTASGSATVGGNGTYYSWVGWPVSNWASVTVSFNNNTFPVGTNPDTINIAKDPTGTGSVSFERLFTTLDGGLLNDVDTNLLGGSTQSLALDRVTLTGDVSGLVDVQLRLDGYGSITQLTYNANSVATFPQPAGVYYNAPVGSAEYFFIASGDAMAAYTAAVDAELEVMGLFTVDLGQVLNFSGSQTLPNVPLPGNMTLTELGTEGAYPKDVAVHLAADLDLVGLGGAIEIPFTTSGSESVNTYASNKNPYYKINVNYTFDGNIIIDDVSIDLYDTIDNIIPEPVTLAVFGLGGALYTLSRRRNRK
ncbi:MAG: PEP-CTERM sorting domain-containing protein [Phycisphaerae bacterium]|nr:PEP-CTERM sorting domain-containing protein [Phycisphaerae bacterium]